MKKHPTGITRLSNPRSEIPSAIIARIPRITPIHSACVTSTRPPSASGRNPQRNAVNQKITEPSTVLNPSPEP